MNIIENNPFRILGVYSNASAREIAANVHRISAYLSVKREVSFPQDLAEMLGKCARTEDNVAEAQAKINLPKDKIKYALFWLPKEDSIDFAENIKQGVTYLIQKDYKEGIEQILSVINHDSQRDKFTKYICGETFEIGKDELLGMFIDGMCSIIPSEQLLSVFNTIANTAHIKVLLRDKVAKPYIDKIEDELDSAQRVRSNDSETSYNAGMRLMNNIKSPLQKLKTLLGMSDSQYARVADRVANQILQCGINYYNSASTPTRFIINKVMTLQRYAAQIAVGQIVKDRCTKNIDILNKTLVNLPPEGVEEEVNRIYMYLDSYRKRESSQNHDENETHGRPYLGSLLYGLGSMDDSIDRVKSLNKEDNIKVERSKKLLENVKGDLMSIKSKLGQESSYYLKISTSVISVAMNGIINAVNDAQNSARLNDYLLMRNNKDSKFTNHLISLIHFSWSVIEMIDSQFDMEEEYKIRHYKPNRKALKSISINLGMPVESEGVWEYLSSKRSSRAEAAFCMMLISIITGILYTCSSQNEWGDYDSTGVWAGLIIGGLCWLFPEYDKGYDSGIRDYFLVLGGCVGLFMYIVLYWPYRGIKYCFDAMKKNND